MLSSLHGRHKITEVGTYRFPSGPVTSASGDATDAYLHAELQRIDDLINDVEMQVSLNSCLPRRSFQSLCQGPLSEELTFIVLDTNIVLHHLEAIDRFINDIQNIGLPVMIIVPGVVINELDGYGCCVS